MPPIKQLNNSKNDRGERIDININIIEIYRNNTVINRITRVIYRNIIDIDSFNTYFGTKITSCCLLISPFLPSKLVKKFL